MFWNLFLILYQYQNRIEIDNAGGLYGNANKENFPNVNDYRNPVIAEAMKLLGYVNRYNRGIARVQKELRENGNGDAPFSVANITVFGVNVADAAYAVDDQLDIDFVNKAGDSNIASKKRYSKEQMQRAILDSCQDYSSLEKIADRVGRSAQYIKNYLTNPKLIVRSLTQSKLKP